MPTDIPIRQGTVRDAEAIARVHVESSSDAYAPLAREWNAPDVARRASAWAERLAEHADDATRFELVAELGGEVVGFLGAGPSRREDVAADLEIYVIHVLPLHRGRGVGGALWRAACPRLRGPELRSMHVQTLAELRCCSFYEARGGEVVERRPREFHGGAVTDVVYRWSPEHSSDLGRYALRNGTADDFEFVHALRRSAFREHVAATYGEWDEAWQRDRVASRFDPAAVKIVVAGGRPIGEVGVDWESDPVFLVNIEVLADVQGRGIGTAIIEDVLDRARRMARGVCLQVFNVNDRGRRLYERLGFRATGSTDTHTLMVWTPPGVESAAQGGT